MMLPDPHSEPQTKKSPLTEDGSSPTADETRVVASDAVFSYAGFFERTLPVLSLWTELRVPSSMRLLMDRNEFMAEVMERGRSSWPRFDSTKQTFKAWIIKIAAQTLLDALSALRLRMLFSGGSKNGSVLIEDAHATPEARATIKAADTKATESLSQEATTLDDASRRILLLVGCEDLDLDSASRALGIPRDELEKRWVALSGRFLEICPALR